MILVRPAAAHLPSFIAALEQGWSPDTTRGREAAKEALEVVRRDPEKFLERAVDREAAGDPVTLPDGSKVARIPGYNHWMWDGEFCGTIGFRWVPGTTALPPHVLGHIGYAVVPWKRRNGYAKDALRQLLPIVRREGLAYVELTCDPGNAASIKVIEANGGVLFERFIKPAQFGGAEGLRYRIPFA